MSDYRSGLVKRKKQMPLLFKGRLLLDLKEGPPTGPASHLNPLTNCGYFEIVFYDHIAMVTYIVLSV